MSIQIHKTKTEAIWMREKEIIAQFGLSHTIIYNLRKAGEIESVSLQLAGNKYGARIYNVASVRVFIAKQAKVESGAS